MCHIVSSVSAQKPQITQGGSFLGWMDVTAVFEGSEGDFDCAGILSTVQSFLSPFPDAADIVGYLGMISTACTDGQAVLNSGKGL